MIAAIFDIDGTLFPRNTERLFYTYLFKKKIIGTKAIIRTFWFMLRNFPKGQDFIFKKNKEYLKNLSSKLILHEARVFFKKIIKPIIPKSSYKIIKDHQFQGHKVILLSAMLEFLVELWNEEMEAEKGIGTKVEQINGVFTGRIIGEQPFGEGKKKWLLELQKKEKLNLAKCFGYGDHYSDRFFLNQIGHPVVVNPSEKMKKYAQSKNWLVTDFL